MILEKLFVCFRVPPFGSHKIKAVKKEQKLYLWNWAKVPEEDPRFENLVALHLMRMIDWARDVEGRKLELRYFRLRSGMEVDFIILENKKPWFAVEVKLQEQPLSSILKYLVERMAIPYAFQVHLHGDGEKKLGKINQADVRTISGTKFLYFII